MPVGTHGGAAAARTHLVGALVAFALVVGWGAPASAQESVSTLDGVYTAEQAAAGKTTYQRACAGCHTLDWYTGDVVRAWEGGTVYGLFEVISTTMPQDNPSSLRRSEYVDVLAYILEVNGMPPGDTPLPSGRSRLNAIVFQFEKENR